MHSDRKIDGAADYIGQRVDEDHLADDFDAVQSDIDGFAKACVVGAVFLAIALFSALVGWVCSFFC